MAVNLILMYNDQTEQMDFPAALDDYSCIFDEICKIVKETFNLNNLLDNYNMIYYDQAYNLWINFNIHVTKHISQIIRRPTSGTLKIRVEQRQRNNVTSFVRKNTVDEVNCKPAKDDRYAHLIVWLDENIGNPYCHKQLKRECQAMINTYARFVRTDDIDILIRNNTIDYIDSKWKPNSKYYFETTNDFSHTFQCVLFTVDNTDIFFEYLDMALELTESLSIIISENFAKELLPIILSRKQKQLLPDVLFLYVLCSDIRNSYEWALGYVYNDKFSVPNHLEFFNDEQALFVRLLNDVSGHLTSKANKKRHQKENWHALQYYSAARQLFLNSLQWYHPCYTVHHLDHLNKLIEESEREVTEFFLKKNMIHYICDKYNESDSQISQACSEILG